MKTIFTKALSVILAALMCLTVAPAIALAADEQATPAIPVFTLELVSETDDEAIIAVTLTENSFKCLDLAVNTCEHLTLKTITFADGIMGSSNISNGKISIARTDPFVAEFKIAEYVYAKDSTESVSCEEFTVEISACGIEFNGEDIDVSESVVLENDIPFIHEHVAEGEWILTVPATCSTPGTEVRYCGLCDEIAETRETALAEHADTVTTEQAATCTEDGFKKIFCNDCQTYIFDEVYPATNHEDTTVEEQAATCTQDGYKKVFCNDCQTYIFEEVYPATNHEDTTVEEQAATCTQDGFKKVFCNDCQTYISEEVYPATGHSSTRTDHRDPTCTENGFDKEICNVCNTVINETTIPATGHGESRQELVFATCTEDGYSREICTVCNAIVNEVILESTGHALINDVKDPTCTEDGYIRRICTMPGCNHVELIIPTPHTGHSWLAWTVVEAPTYSKPGVERRVCEKCGNDQERSIPKLEADPTEIIISQQEIGLNFRQTARLFANVMPEEAAYSTEIIWESSNPDVATVDETGAVYASGVGTATITAKTADGRLSASCEVTVKYTTIQWIIVYILLGWIWYL